MDTDIEVSDNPRQNLQDGRELVENKVNTTQDMGSLLDRLLSISYLPTEIKENWIVLCSDDVVLTYFNEQKIRWFMKQYRILELETISALQGHEYNDFQARILRQLKMIMQARVDRAYLGHERDAQTKQTSVLRDQRTPDKPAHSTGFYNQMKRALFGGE